MWWRLAVLWLAVAMVWTVATGIKAVAEKVARPVTGVYGIRGVEQ
jgi:hypothetical protein